MFTEYDVSAFESMLSTRELARPIKYIDVHHTYRPAKAHWRGHDTVVGMAVYHTQTLGWSEIGQHWSIAPNGGIWSGRDLNRVPCSQTGFNTGALMFEMVGNFCSPTERGTLPPYDTLEGPQLAASIAICAAVLCKWHLPLAAVRFHRELHLPGRPSPKTCPGLTIDKDWFTELVENRCMARWGYDPPGGMQFTAALAHDPNDTEGSGEPEPEALLAFLDPGGSAFA